MYVFMYKCMHVQYVKYVYHMYVCVYVCMYVCMYVCTICMCVCIVCIYARIHVCMYACMYVKHRLYTYSQIHVSGIRQ